ncbi:MAG: hypothetical protein LBQ91_01610 [Oscillospiraceae bacterium]|jgi:hypothetical protein|nr:hypothetical protein [Oscillospiraceae bacterium]
MTNKYYLLKVWRSRGRDAAIRELKKLTDADALAVLSPKTASFPLIYALYPELKTRNYILSGSKAIFDAVCVIAVKLEGKDMRGIPDEESLKWILMTGSEYLGSSPEQDEYDEIIDYAAALYCDNFAETEVLTQLADVIYKRNRRGLFIHDLSSALFRTADPDTLRHIARQLLSQNEFDVKLTCELMGFEYHKTANARKALYDEYTSWLKEHKDYLYITGQYFNETSEPIHVRHDREAKALGKKIFPKDRTPVVPLTENEYAQLLAMRGDPGRPHITYYIDNDLPANGKED